MRKRVINSQPRQAERETCSKLVAQFLELRALLFELGMAATTTVRVVEVRESQPENVIPLNSLGRGPSAQHGATG
ncbi:MAG: hypothetical protein H0W34_05360 [Pyrinomonadaceae bacterium]|nr:hypothetical protein [Pyrinomonadaceae bacterium]